MLITSHLFNTIFFLPFSVPSHAILHYSTASLSHTLLPPSPHHLAQSLIVFSRLALHLQPFIYSFFFLDRMLCCIIKPAIEQSAFFCFFVFYLCSQLIHLETGCSWGRQEQDRKSRRKGWKREQSKSVFAWEALHLNTVNMRRLPTEKSTCDYTMWNSKTVFFSPYTSPPPQPTSTHSHTCWCWVYCGPGIAVLAESAERGKEKQRGEEQKKKKKIDSHRHATLHQDCFCPEREKGGMESLFFYFQEPLERQRKIEDWKERWRWGLWLREKIYLI